MVGQEQVHRHLETAIKNFQTDRGQQRVVLRADLDLGRR